MNSCPNCGCDWYYYGVPNHTYLVTSIDSIGSPTIKCENCLKLIKTDKQFWKNMTRFNKAIIVIKIILMSAFIPIPSFIAGVWMVYSAFENGWGFLLPAALFSWYGVYQFRSLFIAFDFYKKMEEHFEKTEGAIYSNHYYLQKRIKKMTGR